MSLLEKQLNTVTQKQCLELYVSPVNENLSGRGDRAVGTSTTAHTQRLRLARSSFALDTAGITQGFCNSWHEDVTASSPCGLSREEEQGAQIAVLVWMTTEGSRMQKATCATGQELCSHGEPPRLEETLTVIMSSHQPKLLSPTTRPSPSVPCPHGVTEWFGLEGALQIAQFQPQNVNQAIRADELVAFPIQLHSSMCMGMQLLAYPRVRSAARPTSGSSPAKPHSSAWFGTLRNHESIPQGCFLNN